MYYFKLKRLLRNKISYDKWVTLRCADYLVHYNYYTNSIDVKDRGFDTLYTVRISPFMFLRFNIATEIIKFAIWQ